MFFRSLNDPKKSLKDYKRGSSGWATKVSYPHPSPRAQFMKIAFSERVVRFATARDWDSQCRETTWKTRERSRGDQRGGFVKKGWFWWTCPCNRKAYTHLFCLGGSFHLRLGLFYLQLVLVTYGGLFCLRLKFGFVFVTYGWDSVWSFLLTVENRFGLFCLRFPLSRKLGLVFFAYGSPTVSKKDEP